VFHKFCKLVDAAYSPQVYVFVQAENSEYQSKASKVLPNINS